MGCESDGSGIGAEVLPEEDIIRFEYTDTTSVEIETRVVDSLTTYRATDLLFGNYIDPLFGRVKATTYTEFIARSGLEFGNPDDLILDSVVLSIEIRDAYGRLDINQQLQVFELDERVPVGSEASSDRPLAIRGGNIAGFYTIKYDSAGVTDVMFIKLKDSFAQRFFDEGSGNLDNAADFRDFFKGLAITTEDVNLINREPGAIFSMDVVTRGTTLLTFYYKKRNESGSFETQNPEPFIITTSTPRYTYLARTETEGTLLDKAISRPDLQDQVEMIQAGALVSTIVRLPHIDEMPLVAVSRAELVLSVDTTLTGSNGVFSPPAQLEPFLVDENGVEILNEFGFPIEVDLNFQANAEAPYNSSTGTYSFDLTGYVQRVISKEQDNNGFVIFPSARTFSVNRVVFGGVDHPTLKAQLNLTYSSLPR